MLRLFSMTFCFYAAYKKTSADCHIVKDMWYNKGECILNKFDGQINLDGKSILL